MSELVYNSLALLQSICYCMNSREPSSQIGSFLYSMENYCTLLFTICGNVKESSSYTRPITPFMQCQFRLLMQSAFYENGISLNSISSLLYAESSLDYFTQSSLSPGQAHCLPTQLSMWFKFYTGNHHDFCIPSRFILGLDEACFAQRTYVQQFLHMYYKTC